MLSDYLNAAMKRGQYKILDDGTFFGSIPDTQGVWSNADTFEDCREELREVLEDWVRIGVSEDVPIPEIDGICLAAEDLACHGERFQTPLLDGKGHHVH